MNDHTAHSDRLDAPVPLKSRVLDIGASLLQHHEPINQLSLHLISLPCYTHSLSRQRLTHHYCHRVSEDFWQCVMYDGSSANSRLIGVEYVVGEKTFSTFPEEEKRMWRQQQTQAEQSCSSHSRSLADAVACAVCRHASSGGGRRQYHRARPA